jgi:hypothetical protein
MQVVEQAGLKRKPWPGFLIFFIMMSNEANQLGSICIFGWVNSFTLSFSLFFYFLVVNLGGQMWWGKGGFGFGFGGWCCSVES